jgi:hypothetical protein
MKKIICLQLCIALFCWLFTVSGYTQVASKSNTPSANALSPGKGLFDTDKIVEITLSGNIRELLNDRSEKPQYHPMNFLYAGEDSIGITIPVAVKTRGHFRKLKDNCTYPPLLIHFIKSDILKPTIFKAQDKLKLVMPCQGDQYVVREWMVYKLYNLVTPKVLGRGWYG